MLEIIFLVSILTIFIIFGVFFHILPLFFGAAYEGTDRETIRKMIKLSGNLKNKRVVDIGSGDGRIVIEFAKSGAIAEGYEINPLLVLYSRWQINRLGLGKRAKIHYLSFWKTNIRKYDILITFQISYLMTKLEKKVKREMLPGARIISNKWEFENLKLIRKNGRVKVYKII